MRRSPVLPRRVIFIGVEGKSDLAFAIFLGRWCERQCLHLHLDVKHARGGNSFVVVQTAVDHLRHAEPDNYDMRLVLLDKDRIEQDGNLWRDAESLACKHGLEIVFQSPNLEGLLLRLHRGKEKESQQMQAKEARRKLRTVWPDYDKSLTADQLDRQFGKCGLYALSRAAKHDDQLRKLLAFLGLWKPKSSV